MAKDEKIFVPVLDLESDHAGLLKDEYSIFRDRGKILKLLDFLKEEQVKLSVFVVGELLEKYPDTIKLFQDYECEFHCHSYSHDPNASDSREEIKKGKAAFAKFFGTPPLGYRAPLGKISDRGMRDLEKEGFKFDASLLPSYFPNPFKYLLKTTKVHRYKDTTMVEIPATTLSPFKITFALSYVKLLGYKNNQRLLKMTRLPRTILFGTHLHDFFTGPALIGRLSFFWRLIYSRNYDKGFEYFARIIKDFKERGYHFEYISRVYEDYRPSNPG